MIVLRKLDTRCSEKTILPGQTEVFFELASDETYDWHVKAVSSIGHSVTKITSLCFNNSVEFTKYASIGIRFKLSINIFMLNGCCSLSVTNNEQQPLRFIIKVKTF